MIVIFTFFSFFVALSYGAYQLSMNEATYSYNTHFRNTSPNRVVIRKDDNTPFTVDDLQEIEDFGVVDQIISFDYILDVNISIFSQTSNDYYYFNGLILPITVIEASDLDYGTMPQNANEIVLASNAYEVNNYEDYLNKTFTQGYSYYYDSEGPSTESVYRVVGMINVDKLSITNESYDDSFILVTEDRLETLKNEYYFNYADKAIFTGIESVDADKVYPIYFSGRDFVIDNAIPNDEMRISKNLYYGECEDTICYLTGTLDIQDYYTESSYDDMVIAYDEGVTYNSFHVNETTFNKIFYDEIYQISVFTNTDIGVGTFVKNLQKITVAPLDFKYKVNYPYDSEASNDFEAIILLVTSIGLILLVIVTLVGSTLITYVIFRAIINTKLHDYAIFRTIGANQNTIKGFIYLENLYVVGISYLIYLAISISIPLKAVQDTALYALKVFNVWNYIVFFFLLVLMSLIISRKYNNRIFRQSVQKTLKTDLG